MPINIGFPVYEVDLRCIKFEGQSIPSPGTPDYKEWYTFTGKSKLFPNGLHHVDLDGVGFHCTDKRVWVIGFRIEDKDSGDEKDKHTVKDLCSLIEDYRLRVTRFMKQQGFNHVKVKYIESEPFLQSVEEPLWISGNW